jgi:hypothetical protein
LKVFQQKLVLLLLGFVIFVQHICSGLQQKSSIFTALVQLQSFAEQRSKGVNDLFLFQLFLNTSNAEIVEKSRHGC